MTVPASYSRCVVVGNGITQGFALPIQARDPETITVRMLYDGVWTTLAQPHDYSVSVSENGFATVVMNDAPPPGAIVVFQRISPRTQETDFINGASLRAETLENSLDKMVLLLQEIDDTLQRAVKLEIDAPYVDPPPYTVSQPDPGKLLVAKADGSGWEHKALSELNSQTLLTPVAIADGGTGATTAAAARQNLGIGNTSLTWTAPQQFATDTEIRGELSTAVLGLISDSTSLSTVARVRAGTKNDAGANITIAQISLGVGSRSPGAENGWLTLATRRNGSLTEELLLEGGAVFGSATGGPKGAGTVNATAFYQNGTLLQLPQVFTSGPITFSNSGYFNTAVDHGLPGRPQIAQAFLQCITDEHGYKAGDRATLFPNDAHTLWVSSSQIGLNYNGSFKVRNKTLDNAATVDPAKWRLIFQAVYFQE